MILDRIQTSADIKKLSFKELDELAWEIREELMKTVPVTGGHLAANLGVVELTIALHYVLDLPEDKIVWDVGHQSYVHKILTGRRDRMMTMRQLGGLSGFPKPSESEYDAFATGHSSTAISAALGMATARTLNHEHYKVAAVVGDGSMTGGLSFEGLNNCGQLQLPMMIILNDNEMSISKNVGALSHYLSKVRSSNRYNITKIRVKKGLDKIPLIGKVLVKVLEWAKNVLKALLVPNVLFEQLNVTYIGIVDGHSIKKLVKVLERAKDYDTPVLIHVKTTKGKGYDFIEKHPEEYHSVSERSSLEKALTNVVDEQYIPMSFSKELGKKLCELAEKNENIVAITAAMKDGTGLEDFAEKYKDRFFDVGIAEQHQMTFAAGLAISGKKPYVAVYSSFLQRSFDQVIHDVCIQNLPVVICIDRAGITGRDGETHNGQFDMAFLQSIPNIKVFAPSTLGELSMLLDYSATADFPMAIRYGKSKPKSHETEATSPFEWRHTELSGDEKAVIFACGTMVEKALAAKKMLSEKGVDVAVINMLSVKPLNYEALDEMKNIGTWVTAEDGAVNGGIGVSVAAYASEKGYNVRVKHIGIPDKFMPHGSVDEILGMCGMTAEDIAKCVTEDETDAS